MHLPPCRRQKTRRGGQDTCAEATAAHAATGGNA